MTPLIFLIQNNVAHITLNRPEKYNAFNREMALMMQDRLDECQQDPDIRCVLITGAGKAFSSGQDLSEITGPSAKDVKSILSEHYNPIIIKIRELEKPVIAAVNGVAAGAGANIALCCDIVIAARSASFMQAFSKIGLIPDSGGTFILPRLIGWQKASAFAMLADKISSTEAERIGMIYKVLEDDQLATESINMAEQLARLPTRGLALTKKALNESFTNSLQQQLKAEEQLQVIAAETEDHKEGIEAFLSKRTPHFKGK